MDEFEELLINLCISLEAEILGLIAQKAEWEIPFHAMLYTRLAAMGLTVEREETYPGSTQSLDLKLKFNGKIYAVEVKVESAASPNKIGAYNLSSPGAEFGKAITGADNVKNSAAHDIQKVRKFGADFHFPQIGLKPPASSRSALA